MGLSLREWLIIGGAVIVALIVLDGWRRMRGNRNTLKMQIDRSLADLPEEAHNPELPSGGFRVVGSAHSSERPERKEPEFNYQRSAAKEMAQPQPASQPAPKPTIQPAAPLASPAAVARQADAVVPQPVHQQKRDYATPSQFEERDPLFEPLDEFDDGVSAVRVIPAGQPDAEPDFAADPDVPDTAPLSPRVAVKDRAEPLLNTSEVTSDRRAPSRDDLPELGQFDSEELADFAHDPAPESSYAVDADDERSVEILASFEEDEAAKAPAEAERAVHVPLVEPAVSEWSADAGRGEVNADLFAADPDDEPFAATPDDDDLIGALPADFMRPSAPARMQEPAVDNDLDLSKPVSELMRKAPLEEPEPQQEAMELVANSVSGPREEKRPAFSAPAIDEDKFESRAQGDAVAQTKAVGKNASERPRVALPAADAVLVISVVAPKGQPSFKGRNLLQILLACGMRYGDMKIFHRCEDGIDQGAIQFSMANAMEPGYFDIDAMDSFETRGVTFFMSMTAPRDVMNAYECMLGTAEAVAKNLHGQLLDENHSTMRTQTKEHYRERIRKFGMRKLKQPH